MGTYTWENGLYITNGYKTSREARGTSTDCQKRFIFCKTTHSLLRRVSNKLQFALISKNLSSKGQWKQ